MIEKMLLEVLDQPTSVRLIVDTNLPVLCNNTDNTIEELKNGEDVSDTIYYMIDRVPDVGQRISGKWHVYCSGGGAIEMPTNAMLLEFVEQVVRHCPNARFGVEAL